MLKSALPCHHSEEDEGEAPGPEAEQREVGGTGLPSGPDKRECGIYLGKQEDGEQIQEGSKILMNWKGAGCF